MSTTAHLVEEALCLCEEQTIIEAEEIDRDLHRAGRAELGVSDDEAADHRRALRRVLRAWCILRPEIGYAQAMNQVAAAALVMCDHSETKALLLFVKLLRSLPPDFYGRGGDGAAALAGCSAEVRTLVLLADERLPHLFPQGSTMRESLEMLAFQSLASLWVGSMGLSAVGHVWSLMEGGENGEEGEEGAASGETDAHLRVGLALLDRAAPQLEGAQRDDDDEGGAASYAALQQALQQAWDVDELRLALAQVQISVAAVHASRETARRQLAAEHAVGQRRRAARRAENAKRAAEGAVSRADMATAAAKRAENVRVARGMGYVALSGLFFSVMALLVRVASAQLPAAQIVFISGMVRWLGLGVAVYRAQGQPGSRIWAEPGQRWLIGVRSLCGLLSFSCSTYAFGRMELGDATVIVMSAPAWAAILARLLLGEQLHPFDVAAIALSIVGVTLVARPAFLFGPSAHSAAIPHDASAVGAALQHSLFVPAVAFFGSLCASMVSVLVRLLGTKGNNVHPAVIAHAYAAFTVIASPVGFLLPGQAPVWRGIQPIPGLASLGVGLLAIFNQLLFNTGMQMTPAGLGLMMRNVDIAAAFFWQLVLFSELPALTSIFGALLVCAATIGAALRKLLSHPATHPKPDTTRDMTSSTGTHAACGASQSSSGGPAAAWRHLQSAWRRLGTTPLAQRGDSSMMDWTSNWIPALDIETLPPRATQTPPPPPPAPPPTFKG